MSADNKTRLEVQKDLRDNILAGLTAFGVSTTGFTVMEANQPLPTAKSDFITFRLVKSARAGWPQVSFKTIDGTYYQIEDYIELQDWEIGVLKRRKAATDTTSTLLEPDICQLLIEWFNNLGCAAFRASGLSNLIVDASSVKDIKDDSSLYQKPTAFTLTINVPRQIKIGQNMVTIAQPKVKPV